MTEPLQLPDGLEYVRTTDVLDQDNHPAGLLRAHRVADGVWARLLIHSGNLTFVFEDDPETIEASAGDQIVIPPGRLHHVELGRPATFAIEFYRKPTTVKLTIGKESTGLLD